jgi:uncharacterized repeat protein (TIGR01451 family)
MRPVGIGSRIAIALILLCACALTGCTPFRSSGIDPTGQRIFTNPPLRASDSSRASDPFHPYPGGPFPWSSRQVIVNPSSCVAPVGSDVVLMAGVVGPDNYHLRTNERVDWTLSTGSPGSFVDFGRGSCIDLMLLDFTFPRKIANNWVITSTSRRYLRLNQETPTPTDDVNVLRGQSWVTMTSPAEGVSYVTAFAPSVYGWQARKQTAMIHWVDAEWRFPTPAITPAGGRHVFTTSVTRHTDGTPRAGWQVHYEITGGPPAGFAPDGAQAVTVTTNESGQACAEIIQTEASAGVNQIAVRIVRPASIDGDGGKPLTVGTGGTTATWSAPKLAIRKTGPAVGAVGATLSYRTTVTNVGDLPAENVVVFDQVPSGFELVRTNPQATVSGEKLQWEAGRLEPRQSRVYDVDLRPTRECTVRTCAEATGSGVTSVRDCTTTTIGSPALDVQILGPTEAKVGDEVSYKIIIANKGKVAASGLLVKVSYDAGLVFPGEKSPIESPLDDVPAGLTRSLQVTFRVTQQGKQCHRVDVTGNLGARATGEACVEVAPAGAPPAAMPRGAGGDAAPLRGRPGLFVEKVGPVTAKVGQTASFMIRVRNTGEIPLTDLVVFDTYDHALNPVKASKGFKADLVNNTITWTIRSLPIGAETRYDVDCKCRTAAAETRNPVTITAAEGIEQKADSVLEIQQQALPDRPPENRPPPLAMTVLSFANQRDVGTSFVYEIVVDNNSPVADEEVVLIVDVPPGLAPIDLGTNGPPGVSKQIDGQTVRFSPVRTVRASDRLRYEVRVRAVSPGKHKLRARLKSKSMIKELQSERETEILNPGAGS